MGKYCLPQRNVHGGLLFPSGVGNEIYSVYACGGDTDLESVFGALISVLFFDERMTWKLFIGFALIFASVIISEINPKFMKVK